MPARSTRAPDSAADGRRQLQLIPPAGERPTFYTNNTQVRLSLIDATLDLGIVESADGTKVVVKQTARVIMALPHAKRLAAALARQIADWERQHGPIPTGETAPAPRRTRTGTERTADPERAPGSRPDAT